MTAAQAATGGDGAVEAPELCRITVLTRHCEVDVALPLGVPVALLLAGIVDLVAAHRPDNEFDSGGERVEPERWTLARIGRPPLPGALSLDESGIRDGELLVLAEAAAPAPPPLFDDVMYNIAVSGRDGLHRWSDRTAARVGSIVAFAAATVGCGALLWVPAGVERFAAGAVTATLMLLLVAASALVARITDDTATGFLLSCSALPAAFATGMLLVPGEVGAPHLLLATVLTGAVALVAAGVASVGTATFTAVPVIAAVTAAALVVDTATDVSVTALGAGVVAAALLLATFAPRVAMLAARLPLPQVPSPGTTLDPVAPDPDVTNPPPSFAELEAKATRARAHLTGLLYAVAVLGAAGAWCTARPWDPDELSWPTVALAVATGFLLMFRGRTYTGAEKATPLVAGGAVTLLGLLGCGAVAGTFAPATVFGAALAVFTGAVVFGIVAPRRTFTPVQRRLAEFAEYTVIASIVPLVCWVVGLYSAVRGL